MSFTLDQLNLIRDAVMNPNKYIKMARLKSADDGFYTGPDSGDDDDDGPYTGVSNPRGYRSDPVNYERRLNTHAVAHPDYNYNYPELAESSNSVSGKDFSILTKSIDIQFQKFVDKGNATGGFINPKYNRRDPNSQRYVKFELLPDEEKLQVYNDWKSNNLERLVTPYLLKRNSKWSDLDQKMIARHKSNLQELKNRGAADSYMEQVHHKFLATREQAKANFDKETLKAGYKKGVISEHDLVLGKGIWKKLFNPIETVKQTYLRSKKNLDNWLSSRLKTASTNPVLYHKVLKLANTNPELRPSLLKIMYKEAKRIEGSLGKEATPEHEALKQELLMKVARENKLPDKTWAYLFLENY
jgi:hypothetical protein